MKDSGDRSEIVTGTNSFAKIPVVEIVAKRAIDEIGKFSAVCQVVDMSGIYNVGTGTSRSFNDIASAVIDWHGRGTIEYFPMPDDLKSAYQAFYAGRADPATRGWIRWRIFVDRGRCAAHTRFSSPESRLRPARTNDSRSHRRTCLGR